MQNVFEIFTPSHPASDASPFKLHRTTSSLTTMSSDTDSGAAAFKRARNDYSSTPPSDVGSEDEQDEVEYKTPQVNPLDWLSSYGLISLYNRDISNDWDAEVNSIDAMKSRQFFPPPGFFQDVPVPSARPRQAAYNLTFDDASINKEAPEPLNHSPPHLPVVESIDFFKIDASNVDDKVDSKCDEHHGEPSFTADAVSVDQTTTPLRRSAPPSEIKDFELERKIGVRCSAHAPAFISAVRARIEGTASPIACTLGKRMAGGFNVAIPVKFVDGVKWLLKVPKDGHYEDRWSADSAEHFRQSALTQRLVRARTRVPTPAIYEFDSSKNNDLGYPYVLMEFIEGRPLYELLTTVNRSQGSKIDVDGRPLIQALHDVAWAMCQLDSLSFDKIGAPVIADDLSLTGEVMPFWNLLGSSRAEPFDDVRSYFAWRLDAHFYMYEDPRTFWAKLFSMWICEMAESDTFSLYHPDLNANNILVDSSGHLKAIIDWDFTQTFPTCMGKYSFPDFLTDDFQHFHGEDHGPDECQNATFPWSASSAPDALDGKPSVHELGDYFRAVWRYCVGFYSDANRDASQTLTVDDLRKAIPTRYAQGLTEAACVSTQGIVLGFIEHHHLIEHLLNRIWSWEALRPSLLGPGQWTHFPSVRRQGQLPGEGATRATDDSTGAKLAHVPRLAQVDAVRLALARTHGQIEDYYVDLIKSWFHYALWFPRFPARRPVVYASPPAVPAQREEDEPAPCGTAIVLVEEVDERPQPSASSFVDVRPAVAALQAELVSLDCPGLDARLALSVAADVEIAAAGASSRRARAWKWAGRAVRRVFG